MDPAKYLALMALKTVIDPEVGLDVVTMGLVYGLDISTDTARVAMTLTTRGCPMGESIIAMAQEALEAAMGERRVHISLIWNPPWNPQMLAKEGKEFLRL